NIINHKDFLSKENLPVFNSCAIEINLHRIPGLSERFVYFNDDTFLIDYVKEKDFFKKGLPRDEAIPNPAVSRSKIGVGATISNNMEIINTHFNKKNAMNKNLFKWFHPYYKHKNLASICLLPWRYFTAFSTIHLPISYLKSTFKEVWDQEESILAETSQSKFRNKNDVKSIKKQMYKMIFLTYTIKITKTEEVKNSLNNAFQKILPKKSTFEK